MRERLRQFLAAQARAAKGLTEPALSSGTACRLNLTLSRRDASRRDEAVGVEGPGALFAVLSAAVRPQQCHRPPRCGERYAVLGHGGQRSARRRLLSAAGIDHRRIVPAPRFPRAAVGWMAGFGVLHFIIGRYCNFRANSVAGVNLTAPVVQLQVVVTMVLAVIVLHEPCTALQMIGGILILTGSLITQRRASPDGCRRGPQHAASPHRHSPRATSPAICLPQSRPQPTAPRR